MNLEKGDYFVVKKGPEIVTPESTWGAIIVSVAPKYDMTYANMVFHVLESNGDFIVVERVYPPGNPPPNPKGLLDVSNLDIWPVTKSFVDVLIGVKNEV